MRITITDKEYQDFKDFYMNTDIPKKDLEIVKTMLDKMLTEKIKPTSTKKQKAMTEATEKRSREAKKKIMGAINILKLYGGGYLCECSS